MFMRKKKIDSEVELSPDVVSSTSNTSNEDIIINTSMGVDIGELDLTDTGREDLNVIVRKLNEVIRKVNKCQQDTQKLFQSTKGVA